MEEAWYDSEFKRLHLDSGREKYTIPSVIKSVASRIIERLYNSERVDLLSLADKLNNGELFMIM